MIFFCIVIACTLVSWSMLSFRIRHRLPPVIRRSCSLPPTQHDMYPLAPTAVMAEVSPARKLSLEAMTQCSPSHDFEARAGHRFTLPAQASENPHHHMSHMTYAANLRFD